MLLDREESSIETLSIRGNDIGDEVAVMFAQSLINNQTLSTLDISNNRAITSSGWDSFSRLLCDVTSVNKTYLLNHTLCHMGRGVKRVAPEVAYLLQLNSEERIWSNEQCKIRQSHRANENGANESENIVESSPQSTS